MTKQVTITLSDGTPHTGTLDPDGFLLLPRGAKPAEPWWSACLAKYCYQADTPSNGGSTEKCDYWAWGSTSWFRIRPLPDHTWESIAPQQPAAPKRDYTDWQEGLGAEAKPEDYSPEKYEYEVWDGEQWDSYGKFAAPVWYPEFRYRVRRRQPEPEQQVPLCSTDVSWSKPAETDGEFALRLWRTYTQFVVVDAQECVCVMPHERLKMPSADALRLARIIAEAKA